MGKVCSKCGVNKKLNEFYKSAKSKDGLRPSCKPCDKTPIIKEVLQEGYKKCGQCYIVKENNLFYKNSRNKDCLNWRCKECDKQYVISNKDKAIQSDRCRRQKNKQRNLDRIVLLIDKIVCNKCNKEKSIIEFSKDVGTNNGFRHRCKKCDKKYRREYYVKNTQKILTQVKQRRGLRKNKDIKNKHRNIRRQNDIQYRLSETLRNRIRTAIKQGNKSGSAVRDLGCTIAELKKWLENQFVNGMCWENWGSGMDKWNIDHIIPLHKANLSNREEFLKVCHYTNLRPLWQIDNMSRTYEEFGENLDKTP